MIFFKLKFKDRSRGVRFVVPPFKSWPQSILSMTCNLAVKAHSPWTYEKNCGTLTIEHKKRADLISDNSNLKYWKPDHQLQLFPKVAY